MHHTVAYLTMMELPKQVQLKSCAVRALYKLVHELADVRCQMREDRFSGYWNPDECVARIAQKITAPYPALESKVAILLEHHLNSLENCIMADSLCNHLNPLVRVADTVEERTPQVEAFYYLSPAAIKGVDSKKLPHFAASLQQTFWRFWPVASVVVLWHDASRHELCIHFSRTHELAEVHLLAHVQKAYEAVAARKEWGG